MTFEPQAGSPEENSTRVPAADEDLEASLDSTVDLDPVAKPKDKPVAVSATEPRKLLRPVLGVLAILSVLVTGMAWVISSPTAGSPDDDYHLGSIWCPQPLESSGCRTAVVDGEVRVYVPEKIAQSAPCFARHPEMSASCRLPMKDSNMEFSRRYDAGNFPAGYYQLHHLLVTDNVDRSVLMMRTLNLLICVSLMGAIAVCLPTRMRLSYALALTAAWVPMGIYYITSNNPSGWAITGVMAYASSLLGAVNSEGRRRVVLLVLASVGALICCTSRADASFFLLVVSLAVAATMRWQRRYLVPALFSVVASAVGIKVMLGTSQAYATSNLFPIDSPYSAPMRVAMNLVSVPEYLGELYGRTWGAGWGDVPFDGPITVLSLCLAFFALFAGARSVTWRKALAAVLVSGAMMGIPFVVSMQNKWFAMPLYHGRYQLPLLAVLFLLWLFLGSRKAAPTVPQVVFLMVVAALVHSMVLHTLLYRYVTGIQDEQLSITADLDANILWWRNIPVSPMTVWAVASIAFAVALVAVFILVRDKSQDALEQA